jgi:hypothetical protein
MARFTRVRVKDVAQKARFYDPDVEREMAQKIEKPANTIIATLLEGGPINGREREVMTRYIATMVKRVPGRREKVVKLAPAAIELGRSVARAQIIKKTQQHASPAEIDHMLAEADRITEGSRQRMPPEIEWYIRTPVPSV